MMKGISTGAGLCVLGLGIALYPVLDRVAPTDRSAHGATAISAKGAVVTGLGEPSIVWYDTTIGADLIVNLFRAWSDGRVEVLRGYATVNTSGNCIWNVSCSSGWALVSDPNQGYSSSADLNHDALVDGADLGQLLAYWGDAPRHDIPPSDCPLNLINP